ncbi:hypothetical protein SAMD00019534_111780, partial [Acytostelium subglobosum LB1]|uniref:hypothetical protein n=1 Tax=Acytostelium subglobosum LB1 TaxID=1410327 RepID=UPI000644B400
YIPSHVNLIIFHTSFNSKIAPGDIPAHVTTIIMGVDYPISGYFNQPLLPGSIPNGVTTLLLGDVFNRTLEPGVLPPSITELKFGKGFNQRLITGALPNSITSLFMKGYDHSLKSAVLPTSLTHLHLDTFQSEIEDRLPMSLTRLHLGRYNMAYLEAVLPQQQLGALSFGDQFNIRLLPGSLPNTLTELKLGYAFNSPLVPQALPSSLVSLAMGHRFDQPLVPGALPSSLGSLILSASFNQPLLPNVLPDSLTHIHFGRLFNQALKSKVIPASLTSLSHSNDLMKMITGSTFRHCHIERVTIDIYERMTLPRMAQFNQHLKTLYFDHLLILRYEDASIVLQQYLDSGVPSLIVLGYINDACGMIRRLDNNKLLVLDSAARMIVLNHDQLIIHCQELFKE